MIDKNGLEDLERADCLRLLTTQRIGRLGLSIQALPVVLPVNFAMLEEDVVVRTGPGTKLDAALAGSVVAFEVDCIDDGGQSGWSVLIQGTASVVTDTNSLAKARRFDLRPWSGDGPERFIKISTRVMTGRRLATGSFAD